MVINNYTDGIRSTSSVLQNRYMNKIWAINVTLGKYYFEVETCIWGQILSIICKYFSLILFLSSMCLHILSHNIPPSAVYKISHSPITFIIYQNSSKIPLSSNFRTDENPACPSTSQRNSAIRSSTLVSAAWVLIALCAILQL